MSDDVRTVDDEEEDPGWIRLGCASEWVYRLLVSALDNSATHAIYVGGPHLPGGCMSDTPIADHDVSPAFLEVVKATPKDKLIITLATLEDLLPSADWERPVLGPGEVCMCVQSEAGYETYCGAVEMFERLMRPAVFPEEKEILAS